MGDDRERRDATLIGTALAAAGEGRKKREDISVPKWALEGGVPAVNHGDERHIGGNPEEPDDVGDRAPVGHLQGSAPAVAFVGEVGGEGGEEPHLDLHGYRPEDRIDAVTRILSPG